MESGLAGRQGPPPIARASAVLTVMADDEDPEIAAALAKLAEQDAATADNAQSALEWIAGEQGLEFITQERIQNFCWYQLPVKWFVELDEKLRVTAALAQVLDLLQLPRYAVICRSRTTREILAAYETSTAHGLAAFRRADASSGILPPDLPDFEWGAVMGWQEASARSSTADFLEVAVVGGDLVPGRRGWKARQQELVRTHLDTPQPDLLGQTLAQMILTERAESWVNLRRSETRRRILAPIANRLLYPAEVPTATAADPLPPLRWLVDQLDGGIALTQTGNLNRAFVQHSADRFGWDFSRPPRTEDDLFDLHQLRRLAQRLDADEVPGSQINAAVGLAAAEEGFRDGRTGEPPDEHHVSWAVHATSNMCRALGLLAAGRDWSDRGYGLTDTGKATALAALRARATGPRTIPWS